MTSKDNRHHQIRPRLPQNIPDPSPVLSRQEELKLSLATAYGLHPRAICEADTDPAVNWAIGVRWGEALFHLLLSEVNIPAGLMDGQLAFSMRPGISASQTQERILGRSLLTRIRGPEDVDAILIEAARIGADEHGMMQEEMERLLFDWVDDCNAQCSKLEDVLAGRLLPVPQADGQVSFRSADELSPAQREKLLADFDRFDQNYAHVNN